MRVMPLLRVAATDISDGPRRVLLPLLRGICLPWSFIENLDHASDIIPVSAAASKNSRDAAFAFADLTSKSAASRLASHASTAARAAAGLVAQLDKETDVSSVVPSVAKACASCANSAFRASGTSEAIMSDRRQISDGDRVADLSRAPLWPDGVPKQIETEWSTLKNHLLDCDEDWDVWIDWYEYRLLGWPPDPGLDLARATLPENFWEKGPSAVNAELKRIRDGLAKPGKGEQDGAGRSLSHRYGDDSTPGTGETNADRQLRAVERALISQAPVSAVIEHGRIGARDSPPDSKPPVDHPEDLEQRLQAQAALAGKLVATLTEMPHNLGPYLARDLAHLQELALRRPSVWYALDDATQDLRDHLGQLEELSWPGTTRQGVERLCRRTEELRPLLQPRQPEPSEPETPEPVLDPDRVPRDVLEEVFETIETTIRSDGGRVLAPSSVEATEHYTQEARGALETSDTSETGEAARRGRLSRALKGLAGVLGTGVAVISAGIATNVLTVPEAAATVGQRFTEIFQVIARLFS
jgi:hypothetical protein